MSKAIYLRDLMKEDLAAIIDIEERVTGVARPEYWAARIEISEAIRPHWASLVAEVDNRVVGFILGRAGELEFGLPGTGGGAGVRPAGDGGLDRDHRRRPGLPRPGHRPPVGGPVQRIGRGPRHQEHLHAGEPRQPGDGRLLQPDRLCPGPDAALPEGRAGEEGRRALRLRRRTAGAADRHRPRDPGGG